jgi:hypothetical protein
MALIDVTPEQIESIQNRRSFLVGAGLFGLGAATSAMVIGCSNNAASTPTTVAAAAATDTAANILTAALIAESLAITTYYTALTSTGVITDSNLAGTGGTALNVTNGSQINVAYLQGALLEEVAHAQLLRSLLGLPTNGSGDAAAGIPQTFYYPTGTFSTLAGFVPILLALETAFIGAYMTAVEEFSSMAAAYNGFSATQTDPSSSTKANLPQSSLILYAKVASAILGVEAEHRALVRGIPNVTIAAPNYAGLNLIPANNVNYEITDGLTGLITSVSGSTTTTAAAALTPFIAAGTSGYTVSVPTVATMASFSSVVQSSVAANVTGSIPAAE